MRGSEGLTVAQIDWPASAYESSLLAGGNDQLDTCNLRGQELTKLQPNLDATRFAIDLM